MIDQDGGELFLDATEEGHSFRILGLDGFEFLDPFVVVMVHLDQQFEGLGEGFVSLDQAVNAPVDVSAVV